MATLKSIVTEYINLLDKPFDIGLYRRVRQLILNQRAFEISKQSARFGYTNHLIQYVELAVHSVQNVETHGVDINIVRSTNKVMRGVLVLTNDAPLHYFGSTDLTNPFTHANNLTTAVRLRNTKSFRRVPLYWIKDEYLYAICPKGTANLAAGAAWYDPGKIDYANDIIEDEYYDDDYEFLIDHAMLQTIKEKLLKGELGILIPDDQEVKLVDEQSNANAATQNQRK
jgi:hypothetical protein